MAITWDYYSKRRRLEVSSWAKKMKFKDYDHFLLYLSKQDILHPPEKDLRVVQAIKETAKKATPKPKPQSDKSKPRSSKKIRS